MGANNLKPVVEDNSGHGQVGVAWNHRIDGGGYNLVDIAGTGTSAGTGTKVGTVPTTGGGRYYFENGDFLINQKIIKIYTSTDPSGISKSYGSYDNTKELASFKSLGLSLVLFIFSVYLFFIATKLYHQYFDKKFKEQIINILISLFSILIISFWVVIVLFFKGVPTSFWNYELIYFPNQFVLGIILSSLLLLGVGIFRFTIIAFIHIPIDSENATKDVRFSFIGFVFGILSLLANLWTIWSAFN